MNIMPGSYIEGSQTYKEVEDMFNNLDEFKTENDLCEFIANSSKDFCKDVLEIEPTEFKREAHLRYHRFGPRPERVDFVFYENDGLHIVEVKKPRNTYSEINRAISQIMDYICLAEDNGKKVKSAWLVTTKIHQTVIRVIQRFNLPINVCVISKERVSIYKPTNQILNWGDLVGRPYTFNYEDVILKLQNYIDNTADPQLKEFCLDRTMPSYDAINDESKKNKLLLQTVKELTDKQEVYLTRHGSIMDIFRLKQPIHGYRDKQEVEQTNVNKVIVVDMIGNIDD